MEAAPQPHLRAVDEATGELHLLDECPRCATAAEREQELKDQLAGAHTDIATWRSRHAQLKRDKEKEAKANPLWPTAVLLFRLWKEVAGHPRSEFTWDRFEMVEPMLKAKAPKGGVELCVRAIVGQVYDPFITTRKNGSKKHHDGWHLCFGTRDKFEEACCKAPADWRERAKAAGWDFEAQLPETRRAPAGGRAGRGAGTSTRGAKATG